MTWKRGTPQRESRKSTELWKINYCCKPLEFGIVCYTTVGSKYGLVCRIQSAYRTLQGGNWWHKYSDLIVHMKPTGKKTVRESTGAGPIGQLLVREWDRKDEEWTWRSIKITPSTSTKIYALKHSKYSSIVPEQHVLNILLKILLNNELSFRVYSKPRGVSLVLINIFTL